VRQLGTIDNRYPFVAVFSGCPVARNVAACLYLPQLLVNTRYATAARLVTVHVALTAFTAVAEREATTHN
jgi:hypothetical protein